MMTMVAAVMVWFISPVPTRPFAEWKEGVGWGKGSCLDSVELSRRGRRVFTLGLSGMWRRRREWRSGMGRSRRADEKLRGPCNVF